MNADDPAEDLLESQMTDEPIDRRETGIRILLTLLFWLILRVAETVIGVVVFFSLVYTLITQQTVAPQVRRFANHVLSYIVVMTRYLTYNDDRVPFPFDDFPAELDYVERSGS